MTIFFLPFARLLHCTTVIDRIPAGRQSAYYLRKTSYELKPFFVLLARRFSGVVRVYTYDLVIFKTTRLHSQTSLTGFDDRPAPPGTRDEIITTEVNLGIVVRNGPASSTVKPFPLRDAYKRGGCICRILTVHYQHYSFADRRRHSVGRYAQVRSHVEAANPRQVQHGPVDAVHCNTQDTHEN